VHPSRSVKGIGIKVHAGSADRGGSPVAGVMVSGAPELDILCGHVQRSWLADGALG